MSDALKKYNEFCKKLTQEEKDKLNLGTSLLFNMLAESASRIVFCQNNTYEVNVEVLETAK